MTVFDVVTDKSQFEDVFQDVLAHSVDIQYPNQVPQWQGGKTVVFDFVTNRWTDFSESFYTMNYTLGVAAGGEGNGAKNYTFGVNPTMGATLCPAFNTVANLFSRAQCQVGPNLCSESNCDNVAKVEAKYYRSKTSKQYRNTIGQAFNIDTLTSRLSRYNGAPIEQQVNWESKSLNIFRYKGLVPPNTRVRFTYTIHSDIEHAMVGDGNYRGLIYENNGAAVRRIYEINDFYLNLSCYDGPVGVMDKTIYFNQDCNYLISSQPISALAGSQTINFNVSSNCNKITIFFQSQVLGKAAGSIKDYYFYDSAAYDNFKLLESFSIRLGNKILPQSGQELVQYTNTKNCLSRIYQQTMESERISEMENGSESIKDWELNGFYISYDVIRDPTETSNALSVTLKYTTAPAAHNLWVIQQNTGILGIKYNSMGYAELASMVESNNQSA